MRMKLQDSKTQDYQQLVLELNSSGYWTRSRSSLDSTHTHTLCRSRMNHSKDERRTVLVDESDGRMTNKSKHTAGLNQTPGETCSK
jgi:hypothetical protein